MDRLKTLWREERRLNRAWEFAAWREDWLEAARLRKEYNVTFEELLNLCRQMKII